MQGRLSPIVQGKIQSFPWNNWENEFEDAKNIGISKIEWTIDEANINSNPILTKDGRDRISGIISHESVFVPSVTCDYFMEEPPWRCDLPQSLSMHEKICEGMSLIGATILVLPLVDNATISKEKDLCIFEDFVSQLQTCLIEHNIKIAIESDFEPLKLSNFVSNFDRNILGINYDIGNSASYGFSTAEEVGLYGDRIINVHVKDRKLNGHTVPLGQGGANLPETIKLLEKSGYRGNYILQTARSQVGKHMDVLVDYANMMENWLYENNG